MGSMQDEFTMVMGNKWCPDVDGVCIRGECVCFEEWGLGLDVKDRHYHCAKYKRPLPTWPESFYKEG